MKVAQGCVVQIAYDICTGEGEIVESSEINGPVSFVHGRGAIIPGLDKNLLGMAEGEEKSFTLTPKEAFGLLEDAPTKIINRKEFPADAQPAKGQRFDAGIPGGQRIVIEVLAVTANDVTVRMIHPLAGQTVTMNVSVRKIREATPSERTSGSVQHAPPPPPPASAR